MHWTNKTPTEPGRWARRWKQNPRAWQIVNVWMNHRTLYADDQPVSDWGDGYQWSDQPYQEPQDRTPEPVARKRKRTP